jgi:citrate lyase subunit beta / citryl-CoA lyase
MRLRSLLFVPGDRPDQMQKASASGADALILDLEDAVAAPRKPEARRHVAAFLAGDSRPLPVFVRINPLTSMLADQDLAALAAAKPDALVLPKAEGSGSLSELQRRMALLRMPLVPVLPIASETPVAVFRLSEYAQVADSLVGLTWGAEDLPAAIGAATSREADGRYTAPYEVVRALVLFAAHAAAVPAIETVYPAFRDVEGLTQYAARGARDGFTGMMAIHPSQVAVINAAFTPSGTAVERARRVVAAFASQPGAGVINFDGVMLDAPHLKQAQRVLAQLAG